MCAIASAMPFIFIKLVISYEFALQPTFWVPLSCVQKLFLLFLLLRDSEHVPYILPLSSKDSVVVGLGRVEATFLKMDSATSSAILTFTT